MAFERSTDRAAGALIRLVGEDHHLGLGQCLKQLVASGGGQVVHRAGQGR